MKIEIADEQIERLAQLAIQSRINDWFNQSENKDIICTTMREYVKAFVQSEISRYSPDMKELIKEVECKRFAEQLTQGIAEEIAREFCDRF